MQILIPEDTVNLKTGVEFILECKCDTPKPAHKEHKAKQAKALALPLDLKTTSFHINFNKN